MGLLGLWAWGNKEAKCDNRPDCICLKVQDRRKTDAQCC